MDRLIRTAAQAAASRLNGSASSGPTTIEGKRASAMNRVAHGLSTRAALLPGEQIQEYEDLVNGWFRSLSPRSEGEGVLVAQIGDCAWRQQRLARVEQRMFLAQVETELKKSDSVKKLSTARAALEGIVGLAVMAESIGAPVPGQQVVKLMPAMHQVLRLAEEADAPMAELIVFRDVLNDLVIDSFFDVEPERFKKLARAARALEAPLKAVITDAEAALELDRERLLDEMIVGDEQTLNLLHRHRTRLLRELEKLLQVLKQVRELAVPADAASGSFVAVELKILGCNLAQP